ncbi:MAG: MltA domain-containing protein [Thermodesulfobacteriota bacterium]
MIFQGDEGDRDSLIKAVAHSINYIELKISSLKATMPFLQKDSLLLSFQKTQRTLQYFHKIIKEDLSAQSFAQIIKKNFFFQEASKEGVLLTGYYEPIFSASLKKEREFIYPIYRPPDDLVEINKGINKEKTFGRMVQGRLVPYYSREEIDRKGVLQGKGYEIFWLKDPWERFILHVQGSGRIKLNDGQIYAVKYIASNGRPYRSIGQYLVKKGFIEEQELSLRRVKEFFQKNPHLMEEFFNLNERYIFFQAFSLKNGQWQGPMGALDIPLVPGRSIATDHSIYPPGGLCYLVSTMPVIDKLGAVMGRKKINRFVLNQDKGAAMKGPSRVDLFIGSGEEAGFIAGEMNEKGKLFILRAK